MNVSLSDNSQMQTRSRWIRVWQWGRLTCVQVFSVFTEQGWRTLKGLVSLWPPAGLNWLNICLHIFWPVLLWAVMEGGIKLLKLQFGCSSEVSMGYCNVDQLNMKSTTLVFWFLYISNQTCRDLAWDPGDFWELICDYSTPRAKRLS